MPSTERVEAFIARVERGEFVEAIEEFYTEDASMQENNDPPRLGRTRLVEHERKVMAGTAAVEAKLVDGFFINGDRVDIHWRFEFLDKKGGRVVLDELAHQLWRGDRIATERFYYDPAQLARNRPLGSAS